MLNENKNIEIHDENYYKKLTIPNILTVFRMISSIALCGYIASFGITSPLLVTLAAIGIGATDAIDGYLARNCNMKSQLGSLLDPIADKIYNWGLGITLMATGIMPLWPLLIAVRDISVATVTSYQYNKNGKEMTPTIPAKLKMLFQSAGMISTLSFGFGSSGASLIAPVCMSLAIATVVPEVICIKKKYFSKKEEVIIGDTKVTRIEETNKIEPIEKSKILEYSNLTQTNTINKPKIKKKTLMVFHNKKNYHSDTNK